MTAAVDVKALRALLAQATPGPWRQDYWANNAGMPIAAFYIPAHNKNAHVEMLSVDAELLVAAVNGLPGLLDELEMLRAARKCAADETRLLRRQVDEIEGELAEARKQRDGSLYLCAELHEHLALMVDALREEGAKGDGIAEEHASAYEASKVLTERATPTVESAADVMVAHAEVEAKLEAELKEARTQRDEAIACAQAALAKSDIDAKDP